MFTSSLGPKTPPLESDWCILLSGTRLLHRATDQGFEFLALKDLSTLRSQCDSILEVGQFGEQRCFALTLPIEVAEDPTQIPPSIHISETRSLLPVLSEPQFQAISVARHLVWWTNQYRYCGRCAEPLDDHPHVRARVCPNCHNVQYPVIAPAIIVAIHKDSSILLAGNTSFPGNRHSLIAGFVEPGETLEQSIHREVFEEVGIQVHNIQYFCSQPWPFPNSLMMAFQAQWLSGEIQVDGKEIHHADWYKKTDALPELPGQGSIARRLIDHFFSGQSSPHES